MKPMDEIRRANLAALVAQEPSQAAFARKVGKDKNQVNQWLGRAGKRNLGADTAREIEAACGKPRGWMDHEHGDSDQSHLLGIDPAKLPDTIRVVKHYLEFEGESLDRLYELPLLLTAYRFVNAETRPLTEGTVIDLTKRLAARLREEGVQNVERREVEGTGKADVRLPGGRTRKAQAAAD
jgi:hypothetical protein